MIPDYPLNLPKSKEDCYIKTMNKNYDKIIILIYRLGGLCTYDQFTRLFIKNNENLSESYAKVKANIIIKDLVELKLVGSDRINKFKYIYLKKFAFSIISKDYNNSSLINMSKALKDSNFKINLLKVEHYLKYNEIISLQEGKKQLLYITKCLYDAKKNNKDIPCDIKLIEKILSDKGIKNCFKEINDLDNNDLLKLIWIDIYNIFETLRLQKQPVSSNPFYFGLFYNKDGNKLTLHYVPKIIVFDVHECQYYSQKINTLFYKFFNISKNEVRDMKSNYKENKTLGFKGYNHIGYVLKIIGFNKKDLKQKQAYISSYVKDNPNNVMLTECEFEFVDISKYFNYSSRDSSVFENIDSNFDKLIEKKLSAMNEFL